MLNFNISQLLNKIRNVQAKRALQVNIVCDSIMKNIGIDISISNISIKSTIVTLKNISQSAKSAVYIKKQAILDDINKGQESVIARDIR